MNSQELTPTGTCHNKHSLMKTQWNTVFPPGVVHVHVLHAQIGYSLKKMINSEHMQLMDTLL